MKNLAVINNNSLIARHYSKKIQTGSVGFFDTNQVILNTGSSCSESMTSKGRLHAKVRTCRVDPIYIYLYIYVVGQWKTIDQVHNTVETIASFTYHIDTT